MATRIQVRRGTNAEWNTSNPVLDVGELGYNTTNGQIKIGTGSTSWTNLDYFVSDASLEASLGDYIELSERGAINGVAELNGSQNLVVPGASILIQGATTNNFQTTVTVTDPTANRTLTFPDVTGTIATTADIAAGIAGGVTETGTQTLTNKTLTSPVISGLSISDGSIVIEGATADNHETTLAFTDPTADRTITFPNATGTVALAADVAALSGATFTGAVSGTSLTLSGDLTVNGTTTNINSTNLVVEDKNIVLGDTATPSDVTADGGGITLKGTTDHTFNWVDATDSWTSSEHMNLASGKSYKINGTAITAAIPGLTWGEVKNGKSGAVIS